MKNKCFILYLLFLLFFTSCEKKNKNIDMEYQSDKKILQQKLTVDEKEQFNKGTDIQIDFDENEDFDYLNHRRLENKIRNYESLKYEGNGSFTKYELHIIYACEINFGISSGKNIYVLTPDISGLTNDRLNQDIFILDEYGQITGKYYPFHATNPEIINKSDIFRNIHGIQSEYFKCFVINDFNNNGLDEILFYCRIYGTEDNIFYITDNNYLEGQVFFPSLEVKFDIIKDDENFVPIEYCTINGITGFKIYTFVENNNSQWFFYTWNEEEKKYLINNNIIIE
jgi:hypothetical protein